MSSSVEIGINFLGPADFCLRLFNMNNHISTSQEGTLYFLSRRLETIIFARDLDVEGRKLQQNCWDRAQYHQRSPDAIFAEKRNIVSCVNS